MIFIYLVAGLILLVLGADLLVRGASNLALRFGVPSLVVGLTFVAFGTSAPEIAVSTQAAFNGQGDIAMGNVIGSNIFNVLAILGLSALIAPLVVSRQLVRFDVPIMIIAGFLAWGLALDGSYNRIDGLILFSCILAYTGYLIITSFKASKQKDTSEELSSNRSSLLINIGCVLIGLALLVAGSKLLVSSAVTLATALGISELVIGLTIIAIGTSLPELATSVVAAWRGERDIAVGNIVGSNLFNLLAVLGITAWVAPNGINIASTVLAIDFPVMMLVMIVCLPVFFSGYRINRWEGFIFLSYYVTYTVYLILNSNNSPLAASVANITTNYALPITAAVLIYNSYRFWHQQR